MRIDRDKKAIDLLEHVTAGVHINGTGDDRVIGRPLDTLSDPRSPLPEPPRPSKRPWDGDDDSRG